MRILPPRRVAAVVSSFATLVSAGCGVRTAPGHGKVAPDRASAPLRQGGLTLPDPVRLYRQMGLLAAGGDVPFVGRVAFLAGPRPDSTRVLLAVSIPSRSLAFEHEGDQYRATYGVDLAFRKDEDLVRRAETRDVVRVLAFKETSRTDEAIIYQQAVNVPPGQYGLSLTVRDEASGKSSTVEGIATVPRLEAGSVSTPIPFYDAAPRASLDSLPRLVPTPRATAVFGQDTVVPVYLEGYGAGDSLVVQAAIRPEGTSAPVWSQAFTLPRHGTLFSGTANIPVARLGVGPATLTVTRAAGADTMRAPLFVSFGEEMPVATFTEMISYLRYFRGSQRLQGVRDLPAEQRAAAWAAFLRETDPDPTTAVHEGLRDYFDRVAQANARFREEGMPGWLTDRGRAFIAFGNPEQIWEPNVNDITQRGRTMIWDYPRAHLRIVFIDQTGFGRWRMTVSSDSDFENAVRRELGAAGR